VRHPAADHGEVAPQVKEIVFGALERVRRRNAEVGVVVGGAFFQRTEFHLPGLPAARDELERAFPAVVADRFDIAFTTTADLVRLGADVERAVLSRGVRWHCEDRIVRDGNTTVIF
jgi:formyltetrahydrofolate hydrolase